ncbi:MAG: SDR family oxidoreductase [Fibrobacteraceae bacterium]|nr:SDR family oxidoreductase [Fibrobacteraceae bacterium]
MKILLIGGSGTISSAVTQKLVSENHQVFVLNRGNNNDRLPSSVHVLVADMANENDVAEIIKGHFFDAVCEFIAFHPSQIERDIRLFSEKTNQYVFISSASAYHKPSVNPYITEGTTLANPYWQYSRDKIACEEVLWNAYRKNNFPMTIVRPSHTYDERHIPLGVHGKKGFWQVIQRMLENKPVIVQGDGTSLWILTHNTDFAEGFVGLLGNPKALGEAFHITSDESLTWNQIYQEIAKALHVPLKLYHVTSDFLSAVGKQYDFEGSLTGDKSTTVIFDNSKLKSVVPTFSAKVPFRKGVRLTLEYLEKHPECKVLDAEFDLFCDQVIAAEEKAIVSLLK